MREMSIHQYDGRRSHPTSPSARAARVRDRQNTSVVDVALRIGTLEAGVAFRRLSTDATCY